MGRQRKDEREVIHKILTNIDNPSKKAKNDNSVDEDRTVYMVSNTFHHRGIYYEPLEPPPDDLNNRELLRLWRRGYLDRIENGHHVGFANYSGKELDLSISDQKTLIGNLPGPNLVKYMRETNLSLSSLISMQAFSIAACVMDEVLETIEALIDLKSRKL